MGESSITSPDLIRDTSAKVGLYIGPFKVLERVSTVAYRLALPPSLSGVHKVFHVSMLRKYIPNPAHIVHWGWIIVDTNGTFEEGPVHVLDSRDQVL